MEWSPGMIIALVVACLLVGYLLGRRRKDKEVPF
jgi:hypothetical protein